MKKDLEACLLINKKIEEEELKSKEAMEVWMNSHRNE
jgi:hypothetical protein